MTEFGARMRDLLVDQVCEGVDWEGASPAFVFADVTLVTACAWRVDGPAVMYGSGADPVAAQDLTQLVGHRIVDASAATPWHDLELEFDGGWTLRAFSDAPDWESWRLTSDEGELLVAGPGSSWSHFPAH